MHGVITLLVKLTLCNAQRNARKRIKVYINSLGYPGGGPTQLYEMVMLLLIGICNHVGINGQCRKTLQPNGPINPSASKIIFLPEIIQKVI